MVASFPTCDFLLPRASHYYGQELLILFYPRLFTSFLVAVWFKKTRASRTPPLRAFVPLTPGFPRVRGSVLKFVTGSFAPVVRRYRATSNRCYSV